MDSVIQQGRDPEWRLAFEDRLDEAARARCAGSVAGPPQALLGVRFKASETFLLLALDI